MSNHSNSSDKSNYVVSNNNINEGNRTNDNVKTSNDSEEHIGSITTYTQMSKNANFDFKNNL